MLSASTLKLMACGFMLVDHVGVRLFPKVIILRIIGRLAFPLFAYFIGEGCRYTKNRRRHFLSVFLLGCICESVYIIYDGAWYGNILLTFSVSILLIYLMQWTRAKNSKACYALLVAALLAAAVLVHYVNFDYSFTGMLVPLFVACPGDRVGENSTLFPAPPSSKTKRFLFTIGIMLTALESPLELLQLFALLTVPLIALYNGRPGSRKLKYFFYIFYPVHLLLIELTAMIIR